MLSYADQQALDKCNDWPLAKAQIGSQILGKTFNCAKGSWSFSRDGGAVGDINLKAADGVTTVVIPSGAVVLNVFCVSTTAVTSGGSLTLDLNCNAANDLLAATAVASLTTNAKIQGIPDFGTLGDAIITTADRTLTLSFNVAAATAGVLDVYVFYVF